jgi:hypothetical protein
MDEQTRKARELDALEIIAAELENLRILKEHELGGPGPLVLPAGAKRGRSPPPPDVAADPKPGMIAKTRGPLSVKDHSFAVYARCLLGITIGCRVEPGASYFPPPRAARLSSCSFGGPGPIGPGLCWLLL